MEIHLVSFKSNQGESFYQSWEWKQHLFWHDHWLNTAPLSILFPQLYSYTLATHKLSTVNNCWDEQQGWTITYKRNFKEDEFEGWMALMNILDGVRLASIRDKWVWNPDKNVFLH